MLYTSFLIRLLLLACSILSACTEDDEPQATDPQQVAMVVIPLDSNDTLDMNQDSMMDFAQDLGMSTTISSPLDPYLPIPNCVAYYDGECMVYQNENAQDRCNQWIEITQTPPTHVASNIESCELEDIPVPNLKQAQDYLNLLRSWLQLPPITIRESLLQQQCALINWIDFTTGSWDNNSACFSNELNQASLNCSAFIMGVWSNLEMIEMTLSLSIIPLKLPGLERRHQYYSQALSQIAIGRYKRGESLALELESNLPRRPYSLYPGVGSLPFEVVNEGNQWRSPVPWSIALPPGRITNFNYEITQLTPINRQLDVNKNNTFANNNIFVFNLSQTIREGDAYRVDMTWNNDEGTHTAQAYMAFKDCGYTIPNRNCNPIEDHPCNMPGYNCIPRLQSEQWICTRSGPTPANEDCQYPDECQKGLVCYTNHCSQYCDPESNRLNSCDEFCQTGHDLVEFSSLRFGLCTP